MLVVIIIECYCASLSLKLHFLRTGELVPELSVPLLRVWLQGAEEVGPLLRRHLHLPHLDGGLPHLRGCRLPVLRGRGRGSGGCCVGPEVPHIDHEADPAGRPPLGGGALVPSDGVALLAVPRVLAHDGGGGLDELVRLVHALGAVGRQLIVGRHQTRRVAPEIIHGLRQLCRDGNLIVSPVKLFQQFICCIKTLNDAQ